MKEFYEYGPSPYHNDVSAGAMARVEEWLLSQTPVWKGGMTSSTAFDIEGKREVAMGHSACHSHITSLFSPSRMPETGALLASSHTKVRSPQIAPEAHSLLSDFVCSDVTPLGKYVVNRHDRDFCRDNGVIILCGGPNGIKNLNQAMWICKVLRYAVEQQHSIDVWYYLVMNGVAPLLALYVSEYFQVRHGQRYKYGMPNSHCSVFYYYTDAATNTRPESLLGNLELENNPGMTMQVWKAPVKPSGIKGASFFSKKKPSEGLVSDGWGGHIKVANHSLEDILKYTRELQESLGGSYPEDKVKPAQVEEKLLKPKVKAAKKGIENVNADPRRLVYDGFHQAYRPIPY